MEIKLELEVTTETEIKKEMILLIDLSSERNYIDISITLRSIPPKSITMYTLSIFVPTTISLTLINKKRYSPN
jgi:hypothetical protein